MLVYYGCYYYCSMVWQALESGRFEDQVRRESAEAKSMGITGVPLSSTARKSGVQWLHGYSIAYDIICKAHVVIIKV